MTVTLYSTLIQLLKYYCSESVKVWSDESLHESFNSAKKDEDQSEVKKYEIYRKLSPFISELKISEKTSVALYF